jgi:DNA-nicking Smr family endonuclease
MPDHPTDDDFFKNMMQGVKPLKPRKAIELVKIKNHHPPPPQRPKLTPPVVACDLTNTLECELSAETVLSYGKSSVAFRQFMQLKQGFLKIEQRIDLHGLTIDQARDKLCQSVMFACQNQLRLVLIIHGKGGYDGGPSLLKSHVNHWLKQMPKVLAYHSAARHHGGLGAVYVLLKRNNAHAINDRLD